MSLDATNRDRFLLVFRDITERRARIGLEITRESDRRALNFLAHDVKNRFVAVRRIAMNAQDLDAPSGVDVALRSINENAHRGIFLCINRGVAIELASDAYKVHTAPIELGRALSVASGRRATLGKQHTSKHQGWNAHTLSTCQNRSRVTPVQPNRNSV